MSTPEATEAAVLTQGRLQNERLAAVEEELAQLHQPNPNHPDFLAMLQCITTRRDTKISQEMRLQTYKKNTLRHQTIANRSQLLSQYVQEARDIRDDNLYHLGKQWHDIQKERRSPQADDANRYLYQFPTKRSEQVKQQAKYNMEVSILAGVAKHVGFPAAPEIEGAREKELDDDLKAMKVRHMALSCVLRSDIRIDCSSTAVYLCSEDDRDSASVTAESNPYV